MAFANLGTLRTELRRRINDTGTGQYLDSELDQCLNIGYQETLCLSKCHKLALTLTDWAADDATYDVDPIFEVIQVSHNSVALEKTELADLSVYSSTWGAAASGTPLKWMQLSGSTIQFSPPPNAAAVSAGDPVVYGYAVDIYAAGAQLDPLYADTDQIEAIPEAFGQELVLNRAEIEARSYRIRYGMNVTLIDQLEKHWQAGIERLRASQFGDR